MQSTGQDYIKNDLLVKAYEEPQIKEKYNGLRQNKKLTPDQHQFLREISTLRHNLHTFPQEIFFVSDNHNADNSINLRGAALEYFESLISNNHCESIGLPAFPQKIVDIYKELLLYDNANLQAELQNAVPEPDYLRDTMGIMMGKYRDMEDARIEAGDFTEGELRAIYSQKFAQLYDDLNQGIASYVNDIEKHLGEHSLEYTTADGRRYDYKYFGESALDRTHFKGHVKSTKNMSPEELKKELEKRKIAMVGSMRRDLSVIYSYVNLPEKDVEKILEKARDNTKDLKINITGVQIQLKDHNHYLPYFCVNYDYSGNPKNFKQVQDGIKRASFIANGVNVRYFCNNPVFDHENEHEKQGRVPFSLSMKQEVNKSDVQPKGKHKMAELYEDLHRR